VFLTLTVVGLVGLLMMAIPAFGRHGHASPHGGVVRPSGVARGMAGRFGGGHKAMLSSNEAAVPADMVASKLFRFLPSPRFLFTVAALYGAFAHALLDAAHLRLVPAALVAVVPTLLAERLLVRPIWNLVFRFQGNPSTPLGQLLCSEARAVVPFRNGRGMVSVVRDGRNVQLAAAMRDDQVGVPVRVGDRLLIEDVDASRERVTVSIVRH
jgi:hypothetical protein